MNSTVPYRTRGQQSNLSLWFGRDGLAECLGTSELGARVWHAVDRFDNGFFDASGPAKERTIFVRVELWPCSAASYRIGTPAGDMRGCQP